jgi:acyl carrier protein
MEKNLETNQNIDREGQIHNAVAEIARGLLSEIQRSPQRELSASTRLDKDLGMDSLTRVEFLRRIEKKFNVSIPDQEFARIESIQDLEQVVAQSTKRVDLSRIIPNTALILSEVEAALGAKTLLEVLDLHCQTSPDRPHIQLYQDDGKGVVITYAELDRQSSLIASYFIRQGLEREEPVVIMLPTGPDYFYVFWGVLKAGGIPVPIYPPARLKQIEDHLRRHIGILLSCRAVHLVTVPEGRKFSELLKAHSPYLRSISTPDEMRLKTSDIQRANVDPMQTAFLQYTSGSTGQPKGVILSHANLLHNIRAMGEATEVNSRDIFVSWLPLYHDMGLIGAWLATLYYGAQLVVMPPLSFLSRPERWLWAIHRHRATITAAPNFAFEIALRKINETDIQGIDLSSLRFCFNGAEPISAQTMREFTKRFSAYGFRANALMPVYGLAENSLALTFPPVGRGFKVDKIDGAKLQSLGEAQKSDQPGSLEFVSLGSTLRENEIRIVDAREHEVPERVEGRLQFRSPSATKGYIHNPEKTAELLHNGWLNSGDLAYTVDGEIYITGRTKDIVIRGGRKIHPFEVEDAVGRLEGVRRGGVAVFGVYDETAGTERLVVLAETSLLAADQRENLRAQINAIVTEQTGSPPDDIELAPLRTILKTSSGKIRRSACRDLYLQHLIGQTRSLSVQMASLFISSLLPRFARFRRRLVQGAYSAYVWILFISSIPLVLTLLIFVHDPRSFRHSVRRLLKTGFWLAGLNPSLKGGEYLQGRTPVMVANHSSYLDSFVLLAMVDLDFHFIAKSELAKNPILRLLLSRLGTIYVERFEFDKSVQDTEILVQAAKEEKILLIFPEGTFQRRSGLMPFHMGAFQVAARAKRSLLPIVINGTRQVLQDGSWTIHKGNIAVEICKPIEPLPFAEDTWAQALKLNQLARATISEKINALSTSS